MLIINRAKLKKWIVVFFLAIFSTKLIWYDFRTFDKENAPYLLFLSFYIYSFSLFPFIVFFIVNQLKNIFKSNLILLFFMLNIYGITVSLLFGRLDLYLFQDIYKLFFFPAGYAAAIYLRNQLYCVDHIFKLLFFILLSYSIIRILIHLNVSNSGAIVYGTIHDIFLLAYSVSLFWKDPLSFVLSIIVFMLVIFGQKRSLLLGYLIFLFISFIYFKRLNLRAIVSRLVIVVVSGSLLAYNIYDLTKLKRLYNTENTIARDVGSESKRLREITSGFDDMSLHAPESYIFGLGSGASFDDPVPNPVTGHTKVHSFHFTPMAFLYRYGIIGVFFILSVYFYMLRVFYKFKLSNDFYLNFVIKSTVLYSMVMSTVVYSLVDDVLIGFIYGLYFLRKRGGAVV